MSDERVSYLGWVRVELVDVTLDERNAYFDALATEAHVLSVGELEARVLRVEPDQTRDESQAELRARSERMRYRGD